MGVLIFIAIEDAIGVKNLPGGFHDLYLLGLWKIVIYLVAELPEVNRFLLLLCGLTDKLPGFAVGKAELLDYGRLNFCQFIRAAFPVHKACL